VGDAQTINIAGPKKLTQAVVVDGRTACGLKQFTIFSLFLSCVANTQLNQ